MLRLMRGGGVPGTRTAVVIAVRWDIIAAEGGRSWVTGFCFYFIECC